MTGLGVLLFGFGLGVRHALDADHVVVVSTLLQREPGPWRAARVAALWGAGHTAAFLGLGLLVVVAGVRVPPSFEVATELLVAALLLGFGAFHVVRSLRHAAAVDAEREAALARPVVIGLIHGLAGSAGVALLAATTVGSRGLAAAYLCIVALGTVLGMVALTVLLSRPITWTMQREGRVRKAAAIAAGGVGIALGLSVLIEVVLGAVK